MTDTPDMPPDDRDDMDAAEYVLGLTAHAERLAFAARLGREPALAARVEAWEHRLAPMAEEFAEAPAPNLMPALEARLFGVRAKPARRSWRRFLSGALTATAFVTGVLLLATPSPTPLVAPGASLATATLAAEAQALVFAAAYDGNALTLTRTSGPEAEAGRVYEAWVIVGDAAPRSLGLVTATPALLALDALPDGAVLAISLEPAGGSTTGAPTGPVLVTGVVTRS